MTTDDPTDRAPGFRTLRTFHPTLGVPDLRRAEQEYERLFGVRSVQAETHGHENKPAGYRNDYESCQVVRDVFFATVVPQLCIQDGFQRLPSVDRAQIQGFGWYVDDADAAFAACRRRGLRLVNQYGEPFAGDTVPQFGPYRLFCTAPDAAGLKYTLFEEAPLRLDPRTDPAWTLPPVSPDDPLGIIQSSHHTFLSRTPERALELVVDVLGGVVIREGRDELIRATSTWVALAGSVVEYAIPDADTPARAAWARNIPNDTFYAIHWQVQDLERAEHHLRSQGVEIQARTDDAFLTDPGTSMVPWGFSQALVPGDPRVEHPLPGRA